MTNTYRAMTKYAPVAVAVLALLVSLFALTEAGRNSSDIESMGLHPEGGEIHPDSGQTFQGQLNLVDDLKVGDGTPDVTLDGEDAYVEGTFEVDGAARFDGAITAAAAISANAGLTVDSTAFTVADTTGNFASTGTGSVGGKFTVTDQAEINGDGDEIQLLVQGHTTQTTNLVVFEQSDGADVFTATNAGNLDAKGTLQYGANDLYPVGYASSGQQLVYGTSQITGTATASHGLTTVTFCACTLGEDPTSGAGDGAMCTVTVAANVCTLKVWQDDMVTAATETDVDVHWIVVGAP